MKSIQLHTAVVDNGGTRRDAGDVVAIGSGKTQISAERGAELLSGGMAAEVKGEAPSGTKAEK